MLNVEELRARCVELGILDDDTETRWNGAALEVDGGWFAQPSPKMFPDRIARASNVDGTEVVDVYDDSGFLMRLGDPEPDEPAEPPN